MRIFSGMQPSGAAHLGNYLGAMRQHIALQEENECFYFLANYHSLTTVKDKELLKKYTVDLTLDYLALGINPKKTVFFRQSDVPEVTELCWIFNCITPMGILERCHAWKDAVLKEKKEITVGLFNYPILMAADILIYDSDLVPVGKDQKQHVEIARDIAIKFNNIYGETFKLPEPQIKKEVATIPGIDGQKMSKSYNNTIPLFAPEEEIKKQVMRIVTDSKGVNDPKDPKTCTIFRLYENLAEQEEIKNLKELYLKGGIGYGDAKKMLLKKIIETFKKPREKRIELQKNLSYVEEVLIAGAKKAREIAKKTMEKVKTKTGL